MSSFRRLMCVVRDPSLAVSARPSPRAPVAPRVRGRRTVLADLWRVQSVQRIKARRDSRLRRTLERRRHRSRVIASPRPRLEGCRPGERATALRCRLRASDHGRHGARRWKTRPATPTSATGSPGRARTPSASSRRTCSRTRWSRARIAKAFDAREKAIAAQETAMSALNLPSAADLERLTRRLRSVSQRLEGIEDGVDRLDRRLRAGRPDGPAARATGSAAIESQLAKLAADVAALTRARRRRRRRPMPREQERLEVDKPAPARQAVVGEEVRRPEQVDARSTYPAAVEVSAAIATRAEPLLRAPRAPPRRARRPAARVITEDAPAAATSRALGGRQHRRRREVGGAPRPCPSTCARGRGRGCPPRPRGRPARRRPPPARR